MIQKILKGDYILLNVSEYPKELLDLLKSNIDTGGWSLSRCECMRISKGIARGDQTYAEYIQDKHNGHFQEYKFIDLRDVPQNIPKFLKAPKDTK